MSHIGLIGVHVHNLKNLNLRLPLGKLIAMTGVSGAGKSSLAFDTLVAEGQRRYIETFAPAARQHLERIERPDVEGIEHLPAAVAFRADEVVSARATLGTLTEADDLLRMLFARLGRAFCPKCQLSVDQQSPEGVCAELMALAERTRFVVTFPAEASSREMWQPLGFVRAIVFKPTMSDAHIDVDVAETVELANAADSSSVATHGGNGTSFWVVVDRLIAGKVDVARLRESVEQAFQHGSGRCIVLSEAAPAVSESSGQATRTIDWDGRRWQLLRYSRRRICFDCDIEFPSLEPDLFHFDSPIGACAQCRGSGVVDVQRASQECPVCHGSRLNSFANCVRDPVSDKSIPAWRGTPISDVSLSLHRWESTVKDVDRALVANLFAEATGRLRLLIELGLGYLAVGRSLRSLSRGERQRVRLAALLATRLDNALYVLDEPSSGLHLTEQQHVLQAIQRLKQAGNTVVMIEHLRSFIEAADEVVDLGPGAGRDGGRIVFQGSAADLSRCDESLTGAFFRKADESSSVSERSSKTPSGWLTLAGARLNNLRGIDVEFPLGVLCVVTGASGAGKSSLIEQTLYPALCRHLAVMCSVEPVGELKTLTGADQIQSAVFVDSAPIRRSSRTNAATMLSLYGEIRRLFAETTEAKVKNFTARHFSFNSADGGRCPRCRGLGSIEIDMQFLANLSVTCPECHGSRFQRDVLDAKLRGLSIAEVLNLSANEAFTFFRGQPKLQRRLKSLKDVGLGYLPLGQPASTLSRGESQRLKLATFLLSSSRTRTLFIMDEPTAGLHPADIEVLVQCFQRLIEVGHSLIVIEHRAELIQAADWVIELGPGAGDAGGRVVFAGATLWPVS